MRSFLLTCVFKCLVCCLRGCVSFTVSSFYDFIILFGLLAVFIVPRSHMFGPSVWVLLNTVVFACYNFCTLRFFYQKSSIFLVRSSLFAAYLDVTSLNFFANSVVDVCAFHLAALVMY